LKAQTITVDAPKVATPAIKPSGKTLKPPIVQSVTKAETKK